MMRAAIIVALVLSVTGFAFSATIYVPDDYAKIQDAIDASANGDTIIVRPGTYVENIDFIGKAVHLKSAQGPAVTTIDGNEAGMVVKFWNQEGADSVLEGFTVRNGYSIGSGSGIRCQFSSPTITNNIITENITHVHGGGIYCSDNSSAAITDNTITGNTANGDGGGICCESSSPAIMDNTIEQNSASGGGGIYSTDSSSTITDNTIKGNTASSGGGICSTGSSSSTITVNSIKGNTASYGGGIDCSNNCSSTITNNTIKANKAYRYGGGILCSDKSSPTIANNNIEENYTYKSGGGICCYSSSATIKHNTITRNTALGKGGGIRCLDSSFSPAITNNTIARNTAFKGGGIYCSKSSPFITSNTIAGNTADGSEGNGGGGIHCHSSYPKILNSILWNNSGSSGPEISVHSGNPDIRYSNIRGGWPGPGNIGDDPLFVDLTNNDFHLTWNSPCRDAGYNHPQLPARDLEGDPRIRLGRVDMGADEFRHHLYAKGEAIPGNWISIRIIGSPGAWVILGEGASLQDPPNPSSYGPIHIARPWTTYHIGLIPSDGVLIAPMAVPANWVAGDKHYFQALLSKSITKATNLMVLEVK